MRLIKYKVNKFRSVKGTEWIEIEQLTCFVGVNESGKTNLLLPLWKFNPADGATEIDLLLDYPRDEYANIKGSDDPKTQEAFIEVLFELSQDELQEIKDDYVGYYETSSEQEDEQIKPEEKFEFSKFLLIKRDYNQAFYIHISDENGKELTNDIENIVGKKLFQKICDKLPKFVYYSEYGNLDSDLYLPRVQEDLERVDELANKDRIKVRTLKILFNYLQLNPREILKLGQEGNVSNPKQKSPEEITDESRKKQDRHAKITSAATKLSDQFKNWWTQGDYIFHFNADGQYFRIFVSDSERRAQIELESRSKGLQWFLSFFLVFLAESEDEHRDCILLLDEPGLSLHPNAQSDLIKFFDRLSEKNQLIYTTHLPFLVDHNNLDRVKAVYTESGLTKASNNISRADKEKRAIQPVNAAIGITASQSLLIGCDIIIVEGISDQFYLTMIKNYLISKSKFAPKREMVFIPVHGVKGVKPVVSIIQGNNTDKLTMVLLDSDEAGKKYSESLKQGLYKGSEDRILDVGSVIDKENSEIEDLIPLNLLIESFDRLFRTEDDSIKDVQIDNDKAIIPQLEGFATDNDIKLERGWKVKLSKKVKQLFKNNVDSNLENSWEDLFKKLQ